MISIESSKTGSVKPIEFSNGNAIYEHSNIEYSLVIKIFGIKIYKNINKVNQAIEDKYENTGSKVGFV